jgi:hypothetical protein
LFDIAESDEDRSGVDEGVIWISRKKRTWTKEFLDTDDYDDIETRIVSIEPTAQPV